MAKPKSKAKIIEGIKTERKRLYRYFPKLKPEDIELTGWTAPDASVKHDRKDEN